MNLPYIVRSYHRISVIGTSTQLVEAMNTYIQGVPIKCKCELAVVCTCTGHVITAS